MEKDTGLKQIGQSLHPPSFCKPDDAEDASQNIKDRGQYAESTSTVVDGGMTSDRPDVRCLAAVA